MADTVKIDMPRDAAVRALCSDLQKMREGLATMGLHAHILDQVGDKLKELALEVERHKSAGPYALGHSDGWDAAFATGLPGETSE